MSELFINKTPSIQSTEFKYRSPLSSHTLNQLQQETLNDILDLFNKANKFQKEIKELSIINSIENHCYTKKVQKLENKIKSLIEQNGNYGLGVEDMRTKTCYALDAKVQESSHFNATIDKNTADIISHVVSSVSRIKVYDATLNKSYTPPSLKIFVGPDNFNTTDNTHIYSIEDSDLLNAFQDETSNAWVRKVVTNRQIDEVINEVIIALPEDVITSKLINQIIYYPFPIGYTDLLDVQYRINGGWQSIPGIANHNSNVVKKYTDVFGNYYEETVMGEVGNCKFDFQEIETNQLKFIIRQQNYFEDIELGQRTFYLGITKIDVLYNQYTREYSEFSMDFDLSFEDHNVNIYGLDIYYNNGTMNWYDNVSVEYYYYDSSGNSYKINSSCPFPLPEGQKKVLAKILMDSRPDTPNIYMAKLNYKLHIED